MAGRAGQRVMADQLVVAALRVVFLLYITLVLLHSSLERVYALRWSSDAKSPTLFHGDGVHVCQGHASRSVLILSEPLDTMADHWRAVPEGHLLVCADRTVTTRPL